MTVALILGGCSSSQSKARPTGNNTLVQVTFYGNAQINSGSGGPHTDIAYHWAEYLAVEIASDNTVLDPTARDHLSGSGTVSATYIGGGDCSAAYTAPSQSIGTVFGVRVENEGTDVIVLAHAPWGLYNISGYTGSACHPPSDPSSRLMDDLVPVTTVFKAVLDEPGRPNAKYHRVYVLPKGPPGTTYSGSVTMIAQRTNTTHVSDTSNDVFLDDVVNAAFRSALTSPNLTAVQQRGHADLTLSQAGFPPAPQSGNVSIQMALQGTPLAQVQEPVLSGVAPQPTVHFITAGAAAALALNQPTPIQVTATFTPAGAQAVSLDQTFYYAPTQSTASASAATGVTPSIGGVRFSGGAANPTVVITGQNLGAEPPASPSGHVSGLNGCPAFSADQGYDYGTSLYVVLPGGVSAGRYRPELNETDCVDLVVTKFTPTEVDLTFGAFYNQQYPKYALSAGAPYEVVVNGATYGGTVAYT